MNDTNPMMAIICPECGKQTKVESRHVGRKGKCPDCSHKFMIERSEVKKAKEETIRATCPICDRSVQVSHEMNGRKGQCPSCDHKFIIGTSPSTESSKKKQKVSKADSKTSKTRKTSKKRKTSKRSKDEHDLAEQAEGENTEKKTRLVFYRLAALTAVLLLGVMIPYFKSPPKDGKKEPKPRAATPTETTPVAKTPEPQLVPEIYPFASHVSEGPEKITDLPMTPPPNEPVPVNDRKIEILSIAESSDYFMVHSSSATDGEFDEISSHANRILWLNLNQSAISDHSLPLIGQMASLTRLQLNACSISDSGLAHLANHETLQLLSLSQCAEITDSSREIIESLQSLQSLYIEGTQITPESVALLREKLPELKIHN
jgi:DNA-directed RNA polymerase subunit RPC12/RpoP